jgi:serine carboxypeptidase-like clade 2
LKEVPPCVYGAPIITYLNTASVRTQLHVDSSVKTWDLCNPVDYTQDKSGSVDVYTTLKGKYRMLKYSGDTDGSVPTQGTLDWIKDLGWTVTDAWRPYFVLDDNGATQVAGYVEQREGGFTFASVHGAGHMAPQWKRQATYHAIMAFVKNQAL